MSHVVPLICKCFSSLNPTTGGHRTWSLVLYLSSSVCHHLPKTSVQYKNITLLSGSLTKQHSCESIVPTVTWSRFLDLCVWCSEAFCPLCCITLFSVSTCVMCLILPRFLPFTSREKQTSGENLLPVKRRGASKSKGRIDSDGSVSAGLLARVSMVREQWVNQELFRCSFFLYSPFYFFY